MDNTFLRKNGSDLKVPAVGTLRENRRPNERKRATNAAGRNWRKREGQLLTDPDSMRATQRHLHTTLRHTFDLSPDQTPLERITRSRSSPARQDCLSEKTNVSTHGAPRRRPRRIAPKPCTMMRSRSLPSRCHSRPR